MRNFKRTLFSLLLKRSDNVLKKLDQDEPRSAECKVARAFADRRHLSSARRRTVHLGEIYKFGTRGVRQDKFKAVELYTKACDGGEAVGCSNLGLVYSNGDGVRQDKSKALGVYVKACDLKLVGACVNYARLKNAGVK